MSKDSSKLLIVRSQQTAKRLQPFFPDWRIEGLGTAMGGPLFDVIIIGSFPETADERQWCEEQKLHLPPDGKFFYL